LNSAIYNDTIIHNKANSILKKNYKTSTFPIDFNVSDDYKFREGYKVIVEKMRYLLISITLFSTVAFNCQNLENKDEYSYKVIKSEQGYGSEIYKNNKLFINQPFIPFLKSKKTFSTPDDAIKNSKISNY